MVIVDGCGVLHPEGFGAACHVGVLTGLPTIGVAKNLLCVEGLDRDVVLRALQEPAGYMPGPDSTMALPSLPASHLNLDRGSSGRCVPLIGSSGNILGVALRPGSTIKPIYISVGHRVGLATALELVWSCCRYRVPEPTRMADIKSREYIRSLLHEGK